MAKLVSLNFVSKYAISSVSLGMTI